MTAIRPARPGDAAGIAAVHVAAWQGAYATILPGDYLATLSERRQAAYYLHRILSGPGVFVATDPTSGGSRGIVGFATSGRPRRAGLGDGEVETLYVLDDYRERGLGRALLAACARNLHDGGCRSLFLWVLRDNPSRWFYEHLGGKPVMQSDVRVGGQAVPQVAFAWDPLDPLLAMAQP